MDNCWGISIIPDKVIKTDKQSKIIGDSHHAHSCYFRSAVEAPNRKALIQITERCNLHCAHCFVSAGPDGEDMSLKNINEVIIPRLKECNVVKVTLTGGEPFIHPQIIEIARSFHDANIGVGICTNGTLISCDQMDALCNIGEIHVNVSLDGFSQESHGKFRGDLTSFNKACSSIVELGKRGLLRGLLVTPNNLAKPEEYIDIHNFAKASGAKYVLMNPLSDFGRGVKSKDILGSSKNMMEIIDKQIVSIKDQIELVRIRFPNNGLPLSSCVAGSIIYVFTKGELTVCPYLVFAAKSEKSKYSPKEFVVGNIYQDANICSKLDKFDFNRKYQIGSNPTCKSCSSEVVCGKGCPAALISQGLLISSLDKEMCPFSNSNT